MALWRTSLVAAVAAIVVAVPLLARVDSQATQIRSEQDYSLSVKADAAVDRSALYWAVTARDLAQAKADAYAVVTDQQTERIRTLEKDLDSARTEIVRLRPNRVPPVAAVAPKAREVVTGKSGDCESYRGLVAEYFPSSQVKNALFTMRKESGCRPCAVSPAKDYGLMQINYPSHSRKVNGNAKALCDPETNIRVAAQIHRESGGWCPWVAVRGILC